MSVYSTLRWLPLICESAQEMPSHKVRYLLGLLLQEKVACIIDAEKLVPLEITFNEGLRCAL